MVQMYMQDDMDIAVEADDTVENTDSDENIRTHNINISFVCEDTITQIVSQIITFSEELRNGGRNCSSVFLNSVW